MKLNLKYLLLFVLFFIIEILIAKYIHDSFIRPYLGDVLVVILIYFFVRSFLKKAEKSLPIYIFIFAVVVELLQFLNIVSALGLEDNKLARIVIGTTFDFRDIACYFVGTLILLMFQNKNKWLRK